MGRVIASLGRSPHEKQYQRDQYHHAHYAKPVFMQERDFPIAHFTHLIRSNLYMLTLAVSRHRDLVR